MTKDGRLFLGFLGFQVDQVENELKAHMSLYISCLKQLSIDAKFTSICSKRMKLLWLLRSRPDLHFEVSQLLQATGNIFYGNNKILFSASTALLNILQVAMPQ